MHVYPLFNFNFNFLFNSVHLTSSYKKVFFLSSSQLLAFAISNSTKAAEQFSQEFRVTCMKSGVVSSYMINFK